MWKAKEILRLRFELGLGQRQIARSCGMGLGTVHNYLEPAATVGISWPLSEGCREDFPDAAPHPGAAATAGSARKTNCSGTPRDSLAGILPTPTARMIVDAFDSEAVHAAISQVRPIFGRISPSVSAGIRPQLRTESLPDQSN